jgi:hypothetical protein
VGLLGGVGDGGGDVILGLLVHNTFSFPTPSATADSVSPPTQMGEDGEIFAFLKKFYGERAVLALSHMVYLCPSFLGGDHSAASEETN